MANIHTDAHAWLRTEAQVAAGRPFPFGEFSCIPFAPDSEALPTGFLLSRGDSVSVVKEVNSDLWQSLLEEMAHWHAHPKVAEPLPPECWYG